MYQQCMTHIWRPLFLWDAVSIFQILSAGFPNKSGFGFVLLQVRKALNYQLLSPYYFDQHCFEKNEYIRVLVQRAVCKWLTSRACGQSMSGISLKAEPRPHHGTAHSTGTQEHTAHRLLPSSHTVKLTRGAQGVLPQAAGGAGDQWMPIHSEILPHTAGMCREQIPRIFPIPSGPGPKLFRSCAIAQVSYFHSFSSSFHSFSFLLSWFPFLSSKLGLRWAQMVVQGPCTIVKTKAVLKYVDQMEQLETI